MSISPLISGFGKSGFGFRQLSARQIGGSGQLVGLPSKRGLQACAGGVTGAVPHIVKKNIGMIANLFIWKIVIPSHYVVYHNCHRNQQYHYHPHHTPNNQSRCLQSSDLSFLNQSAISSAPLNPFLFELGSPISRYFKQDPSGSVAILLAVLSIPLALVLAFANLFAQIISGNETSVPEAMSLQIDSNLRRYCVDNIN